MKSMRASSRRLACVAVLGVSVMAVASGCGSSSDSATTKAPSSTGAGGITAKDIETTQAYIGGKPGKADASLEPFTIGFVNNQGGATGFPEQEAAADAAVKLVNERFGGVDGHPIALDKCFIKSEEDGQKCAAQLLNNTKLKIGNWGVTILGETAFYKLIGGKFPIVASASVTTPKNVWEFDGGSLANLFGQAANAQKAGAKTIAVIGGDNPAIKYLFSKIVMPDLRKRGLSAKAVYVSDTGTTPDWVSALQSTGAAKADALYVIPTTSGACISLYGAMKQLGMSQPVYSTVQCSTDPMPEKTGGGPENWTITSLQDIPLIKTPQSDVYNDVMKAYGSAAQANQGFASRSFSDILTIARFARALGYDKASPATLRQQILDFRGPAWMIPGPQMCDGNPKQAGLCGNSAANSVYKDGKWQALPPYEDVALKPQS